MTAVHDEITQPESGDSSAPGAARDGVAGLRAEVRALVGEWRAAGRFTPQCDAWLRGYDPEFSLALAGQGWLGLTWPVRYGGAAASNAARQVLTEELLRAGAPVAGHWMGDRQIGPAILRYGSEELKQHYLPRIAAGEVTFCLGMSETEAGSDLASVRTRAVPVPGGWRITGSKVWTSHAHRSSHGYVLARSDHAPDAGSKHAGLTEFIVDMSADGVTVRPIYDLRGDHHFNEVVFDSVFVPETDVLGQVGNGWSQVTEQLAFERGGMERVLSTYPLLAEAVTSADTAADLEGTGAALSTVRVLRRLGRVIAAELDRGGAPAVLAAIGKDVGTLFEGDVNELARRVLAVEPDPFAGGAAQLLADGILAAPGFTIRGGVTEVLRSIISRAAISGGRVLPVLPAVAEQAAVASMADDVLADLGGEPDDRWTIVWQTLVDLGWPGVGLPEDRGGSGGELADAVTLLAAVGRHAVSVPLAESMWAARLLASRPDGARQLPDLPATVAVPRLTERLVRAADGTVTGTISRVPWARHARTLLVLVNRADGATELARIPADAPGLTVEPGQNLAGEPRDLVRLDAVAVDSLGVVDPDWVLALGAGLRAAQSAGALRSALDHTVRHVALREQFGKPLLRFQTVSSAVAQMIEQVTLAELAVRAMAESPTDRPTAPADDPAGVADRSAATDAAAVAAVVVGAAATAVARAAHQLHGAIGVTREHPLHLVTRRLWSWRDESGGERHWARWIGERARGLDADTLWDWVIGSSG